MEFKSSDKKVSFSFILIDGRIVEVDTFDFRFSKLKQLARSCDLITKIERILLITMKILACQPNGTSSRHPMEKDRAMALVAR